MPEQPPPPSTTWEIVVATVSGVVVGLSLDNVVVGAGVGIALGVLLSVLKIVRAGRPE